VFIVKQNGDLKPVGADEFGRTQLAQRIRFWHSDYLPETPPPEYDAPIDDREPPRNPIGATSFFEGLADYVTAEREATRKATLERARTRSARTIYQQGADAIPSLDSLGDDGDDTYRFRVDLAETL